MIGLGDDVVDVMLVLVEEGVYLVLYLCGFKFVVFMFVIYLIFIVIGLVSVVDIFVFFCCMRIWFFLG